MDKFKVSNSLFNVFYFLINLFYLIGIIKLNSYAVFYKK